MSTSMTDHAALARKTLDRLKGGSWTDEQIHAIAGPAQVHATLALEAQTARLAKAQETANIIACLAAGFFIGHDFEDTAWVDEVYPRLGLTPTTPNQEQQP